MKKLLTVIAAAVFLIYPSICFASYVIHLKDGREFATDRYWEEGDQIKFNRYGGVIGIEKDLVPEMELVEEVPEITKSAGAVADNFGCLTFVL
ncbi:MAG: YgdI/YgdR family lipoprotein, partial [Desulfobacteraceae bacterium]|nr:YgdI/YgdR family lipoprotein [Desulfobacteraceae bacterium]